MILKTFWKWIHSMHISLNCSRGVFGAENVGMGVALLRSMSGGVQRREFSPHSDAFSMCFFFSRAGVPLSTQWGPQGYFYPIQIAQYGLSHYSKNLTERPPHVEVYETAGDGIGNGNGNGEWTVPKGCSLSTVWDKARFTSVKQFSCPGGCWECRAGAGTGSSWVLRGFGLAFVPSPSFPVLHSQSFISNFSFPVLSSPPFSFPILHSKSFIPHLFHSQSLIPYPSFPILRSPSFSFPILHFQSFIPYP